jgi:hypothetical protein
MPKITVGCKQLFDSLDIPFEENWSEDQLAEVDEKFDLLCFSFGIENDDLTKLDDGRRGFKIDIPANRYDLLCFEGISRALRVFLKMEQGKIQAVCTGSLNQTIQGIISIFHQSIGSGLTNPSRYEITFMVRHFRTI